MRCGSVGVVGDGLTHLFMQVRLHPRSRRRSPFRCPRSRSRSLPSDDGRGRVGVPVRTGPARFGDVGAGDLATTPGLGERDVGLGVDEAAVRGGKGVRAYVVLLDPGQSAAVSADWPWWTRGSRPMLQASAISTAQTDRPRSGGRLAAVEMWVNCTVNPVQPATSNSRSGRSIRGSRAASCFRRAARLTGSSTRSSGVSTGRSRPATVSIRTAALLGSRRRHRGRRRRAQR